MGGLGEREQGNKSSQHFPPSFSTFKPTKIRGENKNGGQYLFLQLLWVVIYIWIMKLTATGFSKTCLPPTLFNTILLHATFDSNHMELIKKWARIFFFLLPVFIIWMQGWQQLKIKTSLDYLNQKFLLPVLYIFYFLFYK